jgi:hypothetical protein
MANAALTWAFNHSQSRLASRLVILCLSDQLNLHQDQGWICWPSIEFISEYSLLSESGVYEALSKLVELGELKIDHRPGKRSVFRLPLFETWYQQTKGKEAPTPAKSAPLQSLDPSKRRTNPSKRRTRPLQTAEKTACVSLTNPDLTPEVPLNVPRAPRAAGHRSAFNQHQKSKRLDREASARAEASVGRGPQTHGAPMTPARAEARARSLLRDRPDMSPTDVKKWLAGEFGALAARMDLNRIVKRT